MKVVFLGLGKQNKTLVNSVMLITALRLRVAVPTGTQSTMGQDATTTRCPTPETQASISKQSIQTKVSQNKWERLIPTTYVQEQK